MIIARIDKETGLVINLESADQGWIDNYDGDDIVIINENKHKTYSVGFTYIKEKDWFKPTSPYPSWVYDEEENKWNAPIPEPQEYSEAWIWNEDELKWQSFEELEEQAHQQRILALQELNKD